MNELNEVECLQGLHDLGLLSDEGVKHLEEVKKGDQ